MSGPSHEVSQGDASSSASSDLEGLIPRGVTYLFSRLSAGSKQVALARSSGGASGQPGSWSLRCSYVEIYNESVHDLLAPESGSLAIRQSPADGSFFVEGAVSVECHTLADVRAVATQAARNRVVRGHALNQDSSRSHAIFLLHVEREVVLDANGGVINPEEGSLDGSSSARLQPIPPGASVAMRYGKLVFVGPLREAV